jgi:hypothetical protein
LRPNLLKSGAAHLSLPRSRSPTLVWPALLFAWDGA